MPLNADRETERPQGLSVSFSQVIKDCDLAIKWHRERIKAPHLGIGLLYGSALHRGVEVYQKGYAKTVKQAAYAAKMNLYNAVLGARKPIMWDELPDINQDGSLSKAKGNYGKLWHLNIALYWLDVQVPLWIEKMSEGIKVIRSEHRLFVPLRKADHWKNDWTFEAVLDIECKGDHIIDLKSTAEPWDTAHMNRYLMQAHLYMGAYYVHYGRRPTFEFHVLPRCWDADLQGPALRADRHEVRFNASMTQLYIDGVVRPKVDMIESGRFPANPTSRLCNDRWCSYHHHCKFGTGENL